MRLIFERSEEGRFKRLKRKWRKPRGISNKIKKGKKGLKPKIGYKKPERKEVPKIRNLKELNGAKLKEIIIDSRVGNKKRLEIQEYCSKNNIKVLNEKIIKPKEKKSKKAENKTKTKEKEIQKELSTETEKKPKENETKGDSKPKQKMEKEIKETKKTEKSKN